MFETIKLLYKITKLKALDKELASLTARRKNVKAKARRVQAKYEALKKELDSQTGSVKIDVVK